MSNDYKKVFIDSVGKGNHAFWEAMKIWAEVNQRKFIANIKINRKEMITYPLFIVTSNLTLKEKTNRWN